MKKSVLMGIGLTLTVLCLTLLIAPTRATVYSGSGTTPYMYPAGKVYLTINTGTYSGKISWEFPAIGVFVPLLAPGGLSSLTWRVWDDKGLSYSGSGRASGSVPFWFPHKNTWVHAQATGIYVGINYYFPSTARVDLYIAT